MLVTFWFYLCFDKLQTKENYSGPAENAVNEHGNGRNVCTAKNREAKTQQ